MADFQADIDGAARLSQTLRDAGDALDDMATVSQAAGADVLGQVDPPVRTGRLAGTVRLVVDSNGFTITAGGPDAPYAPKVHAYAPFLTAALLAREDTVIDAYTDHVADVVDTIEGA